MDGSIIATWGGHVLRSAFQPIFRFTETGGLQEIASEALLRPFVGASAVPPLRFFASLSSDDLVSMEMLSRHLHIANAGRHLAADRKLFLNIDPSLFGSEGLWQAALADMRAALDGSGMSAQRVVCELTEQKSPCDATLAAFVRALRSEGFRIAVDDYGSRESDLSRIDMLQPDIVKFDGKWITRLMNSAAGFSLLTEMVRTFADRGIQSLFEGIETDWQLELTEKSGAAMVQGYVLGRPAIVSDVR